MSGLLTGQSLRPRVSSKNHPHPANPFLILLKLDRWVGRMTPHEQCNSNQQHQPKVHQRGSKLAQAHLRLLQLQYKGVSTPFSVQLRHVSNRWNKNTHHVKNTHTHTHRCRIPFGPRHENPLGDEPSLIALTPVRKRHKRWSNLWES